MKTNNWGLALLCIILTACGGGGDGGGGGGTGAVGSGGSGGNSTGSLTIREPIVGNGTVSTFEGSIAISGTSFVSPDGVDCVSIFPGQLTMNWHNVSTGQSQSGYAASNCVNSFLGLQVNTSWGIPFGAIDLQVGENRIEIEVKDQHGKTGTGTLIVQRMVDQTAPRIASLLPAANTIDVPINRSLSVRFNESMRKTSLSVQRFTLRDASGLEVPAFRTYDSDNFTWRLDPNADLTYSTSYTATISGDVEDAFGNKLGADRTWSFVTAANPDVTPPTVSEVSPGPGNQCVAAGNNVVASFDEVMDSASIDASTFTLSETGGAAVVASVAFAQQTATLDPVLPLLAGTDYTAIIDASIMDLAGNEMGADFSWSFRISSNASAGDWQATNTNNAPFARRSHTAVWTGSAIIVWGGYGFDPDAGSFTETKSGARYSPVTDSWSAMSSTGVAPHSDHSAVFTGTEMIIWGGNTDTGGRYDPGTDSWQSVSTTNAPSARSEHAAIWTGTEMIVWGGEDSSGITTDTGGRYDPATDTWQSMSTTGAPEPRRDMAFVWTGTEFIVWGGVTRLSGGAFLVDGARYNPTTDTWTALPATGVHGGSGVVAAWTGTEMLLWNGGAPTFVGSDGFPVYEPTLKIYDPVSNTWRASASPCEPHLSSQFYAQWTGSQLFTLSAGNDGGYFYDPLTDDWQAISTTSATEGLSQPATVWANGGFFLWGGQAPNGLRDTGAVFQE